MAIRRVISVILVWLPAAFVAGSLLAVLLMRQGPVRCTPLMLLRRIEAGAGSGEGFVRGFRNAAPEREWVPLTAISGSMVSAAMAAEDSRFPSHCGFDLNEMEDMWIHHKEGGSPLRGCSTISQQTARNCFTFCTPTLTRKVVEAWFTVLIERIWGKRRIMEVYLNVAETGPGIYGVQAAARRYYGVSASDLALSDASALACCLPDPLHRTPYSVRREMPSHMRTVACRAAEFHNGLE